MPAAPLSFRWDSDFIARIDAARGQRSRSAFVREAVRLVIEAEECVDPLEQASHDLMRSQFVPDATEIRVEAGSMLPKRKTLRQELDECGGGTPLPPKVPPRGGY